MKTNVIEIDGKYYLELPCRPGTVVYYVSPYIDINDPTNTAGQQLKASYRINKESLATVDEIFRNMHSIGKSLFLTEEEAEEYKRKVELGICDL